MLHDLVDSVVVHARSGSFRELVLEVDYSVAGHPEERIANVGGSVGVLLDGATDLVRHGVSFAVELLQSID